MTNAQGGKGARGSSCTRWWGLRGAVVRGFVSVGLGLLAAGAAWASRQPSSPLLEPRNPRFGEAAPARSRVKLETSQGTVELEIHRAWAPRGADRFYNLVRHGFYDGVRFNRVIAGAWAQFGINGDPTIAALWRQQRFTDDPVVESNRLGFLSFAMAGPNDRTTQVFINLSDNPQLDERGFAPFGRVVEGMGVVDRLYSGYGESAGGGIRGGKQDPLFAGGNAYMAREFPKLDYIVEAAIID